MARRVRHLRLARAGRCLPTGIRRPQCEWARRRGRLIGWLGRRGNIGRRVRQQGCAGWLHGRR